MQVSDARGFRFTAPLWPHLGEGSWYFVTVPDEVSDEIRDLTEGRRAGSGSVRVSVTVGGSTWRTSLFPDKSGNYLLPVKKQVRTAESLDDGSPVHARVELEGF